MRVRIGTLNRILAAGLCAGLATYLTVTSVGRNAPSRAVALPPIDVQSPPNPGRETKTVIVAAAPLRFGTTLTSDVVAEMEWPSSSVPVGAFTSREALLGPAGQRTVLVAIAKNEPILAAKITGPGQRGTLSAVIDVDMKAVTIRVDDVLGVAGFVQPDDRVDVLLTRNGNDRPTSPSPQSVSGAAFSDLLLQNVRVLAIDQIADRSGQAKPAKAVTIEVTTEDAQKVALGASVGQLSLALRQAGSLQTTVAARRISLEDLGKTSEVEGTRPSSSPIVTVTRGARERMLYELTPTGRRELGVASEAGVSQVIAKPQ